MYKVTVQEEVEAGPTAPPVLVPRHFFLTAKEVERFAETHEEFEVETVQWIPSRED